MNVNCRFKRFIYQAWKILYTFSCIVRTETEEMMFVTII